MKILFALSFALLMGAALSSSAGAEQEKRFVSVLPSLKPAAKPAAGNPAEVKAQVPMQTPARTAPVNPAIQSAPASQAPADPNAPLNELPVEALPTMPAPKSYYSAALEQSFRQYKSAPSEATYSQLLGALRSVLASPGGARIGPAILVKDNPYFADFKPRLVESPGLRLWSFPKAPERAHMLLQFFDSHQQIVGTGRRKRVVSSTVMRIQDLKLPAVINVKDGGIITSKELGKHLVLAGDNEDASLWVAAYKLGEGGWQPSPDFLSQIPSYLLNNVSGRLGFRGNDLIFNIGKMLLTTDSTGAKRWLPEAESASYRFWLKLTDSGYVLAPSIPNEEAFAVVHQFMGALQHNRTDVLKTLLVDPHLISIPRYLGLQGKNLDSAARVVEMSLPPARGQRFRLINIGKDDLIFDVGKVKGVAQIKALFVAQPDPFLQENSKSFPFYSHFDQPVIDPKAAEAAAAAASPAAGAAPAPRKK